MLGLTGLALFSLSRLKETFSKDLDYLEEETKPYTAKI
jgi:hypothetical protein